MAARPRSKKHKDLPPNLYESNGNYQWRDPRDGKRYGLGPDKTDAINEAVEANLLIYNLQNKVRLADRLQGADILTLGNHLDNFLEILKKRELADGTLRQRGLQIGYIKDQIGDLLLSRVTTKDVAGMMDSYVQQGKKATAVKLRQILNDAFNEAIAAGHLKENPVTPTKAPANKVLRSRLTVTEYNQILGATGDQEQWVKNMFDLALVTGQRREDLAEMKFKDVRDGFLWVVQIKTGARVSLPLSLSIPEEGLVLEEVISRCRTSGVVSKYLLHTIRGTKKGSGLKPGTLSKGFSTARDKTDLRWPGTEPSLHEIRSLAARLYTELYGKEVAQAIMGHKTAAMTDLYRDTRGAEWITVKVV
ncbi:tyrosine-type recombinase/integrase [Serratia sp. JSRIV002]|uniref:tyrosine-type recombinase/integrase n=1 Tax=Serratia sp. JSRIV002 TaxID=2831894 RepID=UPI001CBFCFFC|nr:tyrosine-type recombinase/integrase [Serratia sp. JSRIV002]UAN52880.1 tyrosine-type recombinase/integrase [Serratia sp. JSRIV002]